MNLLDELVKKNIIQQRDVARIQKEIAEGGTLEESLIKLGKSDEDILDTKGEVLNIPVRHLKDAKVPFEILKYIPEESALHYRFVPVGIKDRSLEVGLVDPDNIEARDALNFISSKINLPFRVFLISSGDFQKVIEMYKGLSGEVTQALSELETDLSGEDVELTVGNLDSGEPETGKTDAKIIEDAPVTKIVATVLRYAIEGGASDVHIEPLRETVRVRFRVDGELHTSLVLPIKVHMAVVARIKVLSNMKLDEKRKPQDGRFSAKIEGRKIDFRVSTFPTYFGEKVVMRILDQQKGVKKLDELGISPLNIKLLRDAIARPYGLILISGPTGSGKTTTLYSMLNEVDREGSNVLSLEDPIEYNIEGISQSQVKPEIGYTFANGLRTTLRQDPDVIMVGEIRDKETAQLAVQAALTGHLVLSTIHTNSSVGVIPRLIDMGVDPYLIAPTLILAVAQRLVRTLAPGGGKEIPIDGSVRAIITKEFSDLPEQFKKDIVIPEFVYEASPTPDCPSGIRGRTPVFEVIKMDKDIENIILKNPTEIELWKEVRKKGVLTMREDAMLKAFKREIPFEEVNKL